MTDYTVGVTSKIQQSESLGKTVPNITITLVQAGGPSGTKQDIITTLAETVILVSNIKNKEVTITLEETVTLLSNIKSVTVIDVLDPVETWEVIDPPALSYTVTTTLSETATITRAVDGTRSIVETFIDNSSFIGWLETYVTTDRKYDVREVDL